MVQRLVDQFDLGSLLSTWIKGCFFDAAALKVGHPANTNDDGVVQFEQDMEQSSPWSPFHLACTNETQREAMGRPLFASLLRCLGFVKVNRDAWEVPSGMGAEECIKNAELLEKAIDDAEKGIGDVGEGCCGVRFCGNATEC